MKFPFSNIFKSQNKKLPIEIEKKLKEKFPLAKNLEWEKKEEFYETIFYLEEIEHIAQFTKGGEIIEYKKNLWPAELPENIKTEGVKFGEIMNGIIICRGGEFFYEMIIRNEKLDRYEFLYDQDGNLLKSSLL
jgi:hypothetical protein